MRRLAAALAALALAGAADARAAGGGAVDEETRAGATPTAAGEGAAGADARDDAIFGGEDARDDAIFGGEDARDDAIFGADDARDDAIFGDDPRDDGIFGGDPRDDAIFGDDDARDEAIFGDVEPAAAPADRPVRPSTGDGLLSTEEIDRRLRRAGDKLAIGGLIYLRAQYDHFESQEPQDGPFSSPNLFDLYLDARPNDDLRFFARARVTHRFAAARGGSPLAALGEPPPETEGALDQLWLKFDVDDVLFVTAGRQPIKWGAGRFWNPTDVLNRSRRDPIAVFDERLGVSLVKLHLPVESSGWNFYAIGDFDDAETLGGVGGALRVEKLIGDTELSVSAAAARGRPLRVGADVSFPLWDFDVRAEAALTHGDETTFFRGVPEVLLDTEPYSRESEWIPQAVVGLDYSFLYSDDDSLTIGAEYFFNDAGYDDPRYYPALFAAGSFTPLYAGRHYAAFYASAVGPGRWNDTTMIASALGNLSDRSWIARFDYRVRLLTYLDVNAFVDWHFGRYGEFRLGMDLPEVDPAELERSGLPPAVASFLASGSIPAPTFTLGGGMQLRF